MTSVVPKPDPRLPKPVLPIDDATLAYFGGRLPSSTELKSMLTGVPADDLDDEVLKRWSPRYRAHPRLPPHLLLHGDRDALTALEQSVKMRKAAREVGADAELIVVEGANHEGREFDSSDLAARVASFLRTHREGERAGR